MMKIKYNSIYYPEGEWVDENGNKVEMRKKNFHAKYNGRNIFIIIKEVSVNDGHMTIGPSPVPTFYDAETLDELKFVGYIEPNNLNEVTMEVQLVNGPCEGMKAQVKLNDEGMPPSTYIAELPAVCNDVHVDGIVEPFYIAPDKFIYELHVTVRNGEPPHFEYRFPER